MPSQFVPYPLVPYTISSTRKVLMTNIARRFVLVRSVLARSLLFEPYVVHDGQRPDLVAQDYYDDATLDWLVMMANQVFHPQFEWYMGYQDFIAFIIGKYGDLATAHQTVHHYEKQMTDPYIIGGQTTVPIWKIVDSTTYHATPEDHRKQVSCFEYEDLENKKRQKIQLVHKSFVGQILEELKTVLVNA